MELYIVTEFEYASTGEDPREQRIIGVFDSAEAVANAAKELGYRPRKNSYYSSSSYTDVYVTDRKSYSGFDMYLEVEDFTLNDYVNRYS